MPTYGGEVGRQFCLRRADCETARVDRVTISSLQRCVAAREVLAQDLSTTDHDDPDFPELLRRVRDANVFTGAELAKVIGLSRARLYEIMSDG